MKVISSGMSLNENSEIKFLHTIIMILSIALICSLTYNGYWIIRTQKQIHENQKQ